MMASRFDPGGPLGEAPRWAACALPAAAAVDQAQLQQALDLGQRNGAGSIVVYVDGAFAGKAGPQTTRYDLKSSTKSFGALLLCLALKDHKVSLNSRGSALVPDFGQP